MKVVVISVTAFGLVTIVPALTEGTPGDRQRALVALAAVMMFVAIATTFAVAIGDSYIDVDDRSLFFRFEAFFSAELPLADIVAVREIDPRPRWRFRFGLSTDFRERICCSHGGRIVEVELRRARPTRLWPRRIGVRRFWLAVAEHDEFIAALRAGVLAASGQPPSVRQAAA